jgi:hypothetical protein
VSLDVFCRRQATLHQGLPRLQVWGPRGPARGVLSRPRILFSRQATSGEAVYKKDEARRIAAHVAKLPVP